MKSDEEIVEEFGQWVAEYTAEAGDAAIATKQLVTLRQIVDYFKIAISDLEKQIAEEFGDGQRLTPFGAVTVRSGAETFVYPKAGTGEHKELFNHVVSRCLDLVDPDAPERPEQQVANQLFKVWPMGPREARSTALKKLGLKISEYRLSGGRKTSVQVQ